MRLFSRSLAERIVRAAERFSVVVLTGARQTGKTTLLRRLFPDHGYVSLDLPSEALSAEREPDAFLARHGTPLLVDEVQYAPSLFRHVKVVVDRVRDRGAFILTGSQKLTLMQGVTESLAGRAAVLELEALSAEEIRAVPSAARLLADVPASLERGFMPAVWADPKMPTDEFWRSYVATYLERDLRQLVHVKNLRDFERFLRLAAVRSGQLLNKTDLARDAGVSTKTASSWLAALEATNQIMLLTPFFTNVGKRLVKSPKLYLSDPGLSTFLLGLDAATLRTSPLAGSVWETAVYAELRKTLAARGARGAIHFYRDHDGAEIDFVVEDGRRLDLIECKWTELPSDRDGQQLDAIAAHLASDPSRTVRRRIVACRARNPFPLTPTADAVHGWELPARLG